VTCRGDEAEDAPRLAALAHYGILDTDRDPPFDDIAELAAELLDAPIAVVNFIAADRQWFKAERGIGVREMPLGVSICRHVFLQPGVTVVPDLQLGARFSANPLVAAAGGLRFCAGASIQTPEGLSLGTVCVLDTAPRPDGLAPRQERALRAVAAQVTAQLELRRAAAKAREDARRFNALFEQSAVGALQLDLPGCWPRLNQRLAEMLGYDAPSDLVGFTCFDLTHPDDKEADRPLLCQLGAGEISFYRRTKRYLRRDGTPVPVEVTVSLIRDEHGAPAYGSAIAEDLSERLAAEEAAAATARRSAFLLDLETQLRGLTDIDAVIEAGTAAIGGYLGVAQVGIGEVEATTTHIVVRRDWNDGRIPSVVGTWRMTDFGPTIVHGLNAGQTIAIPDIAEDARTNLPTVAAAFAGIRTRSLLVECPLSGG
jgi:PAS domain S-box-containing protein